MSNNLEPLKPIKFDESITNIDEPKAFGILTGASNVAYKEVLSTNFSNVKASFTLSPASPDVFVDRFLVLRQPMQVTLTKNGDPNPQNTFQSGFSAPRAFPLSSIIETLIIRINNGSETIELANTIDMFSRYNNDEYYSEYVVGTTPTYKDQSQAYSELASSTRNPLGSYFDTPDFSGMPRGGFSMTVVSNTPNEAVINIEPAEPLFISPLYFGDRERPGFIGLTTFNIDVNYSNLQMVWSHDDSSGSVVDTVSVTLFQPSILMKEVTPDLTVEIPKNVMYPYHLVDFKSQTSNTPILAGGTSTVPFNNVQLNAIPTRVYIAARRQKNARDFKQTDTFFAINKINVTFEARNGLLSSATQEDLYRISRLNGSNETWTQWSGKPAVFSSGLTDTPISTVGGVLCLRWGKDLGLNALQAPGIGGTFNFSYKLDIKNLTANTITDLELATIFIFDGVYNLESGRVFTTTAPVTKEDVIIAEEQNGVDFSTAMVAAGGGTLMGRAMGGQDFLETIGKVGKDILSGITSALPIILQILPLLGLGDVTPEQIKKILKEQAGSFHGGRRNGGALVGGDFLGSELLLSRGTGGALVGGRDINRNKLKRRIQMLRR